MSAAQLSKPLSTPDAAVYCTNNFSRYDSVMADSSAKKENWSLQSHDGPCSNCRVRKIKCGREKPECSICRQAQVECVYTPPPKRVNHVKVLCESFDEVNDRLNMVQAQLSALTSMLEASTAVGTGSRSSPGNDPLVNTKADHHRRASCPNLLNRDTGDQIVPGGFVIREEGTLNERYYGPWTLDHECRNFCHAISSSSSVVPSLLQKFQRALESTPVDLPSPKARQGQNTERLLPKVFLSVMVEHFVDQADFCTDIFLRTSLATAVDRVYSDSRDPLHEAWAVCLDLIFLFVLGAEQPLRAADHTQPLFDAVDSAISKQQLFMAPRLIAVQTLALLSLIAPSYYPESISDVLFAQACHLATMMGLHCHDTITPGQLDLDLSLDEIVERRKLFRSLYIRERCYATARGTLRRLPRYLPDSSSGASSRALSQGESLAPLIAGRGQSPLKSMSYLEPSEPFFTIAMIQDELHAAIFQGSSPDTRGLDQKVALSSIRQKLVEFAQTHRLPFLKRPQAFQDLSLHLAYLGTRIRAYEFGDEHHVLDDARLSCLLVVSACSDENSLDMAAAEKLGRLLSRMAHRDWCADNLAVLPGSPGVSDQSSIGALHNGEERTNSPKVAKKRFWPFGSETLLSSSTQVLRNQRVLELMPTSAIFILARSILRVRGNTAHWSSSPSGSDLAAKETPDDELFGSVNGDFMVLCELSRVLEDSLDVSSGTQNSHSSKLLRVTQTLVSFLREAVNPPEGQSSPTPNTGQDTLDCSTRTEMPQNGVLNPSASSSAAEASLLNLGVSWESPQVSSSLSIPFSPSFDLSSMNISTVPESLFDFDFSQHFESMGGFVSPAEHLPDTEALRNLAEQEKRRKRLRLDCSQDLDGPVDIMLSTWPQRNRATMASGSV